MRDHSEMERRHDRRRNASAYPMFIVLFSLLAITSTFFLANSSLEATGKIFGFSGIIVMFLFACVTIFLGQSKRRPVRAASGATSNGDVERGLAALDEAGEFFVGSLKPCDTFRLVTSRVRDLMPVKAMALYLLDGTRSRLCVAQTDGMKARDQNTQTIGFDEGLAGQCYSSRQVEIDSYMSLDAGQEFGSSAAIPLCHGTEVFGVLQLFFETDFDMAKVDQTLFEAVGTRISPLMLASIALERSQANALTDITTDLPNERAFYLILENQIAEAQRKREDRPLTILAIDIQNFSDINQRFGHASGDRVLNFVAQNVKDNLRQMDFFARSIGDEFLAVLPTASKEVSHDVIARIHTGFFGRKFDINSDESVEIELNIGWASFGPDGETPGHLLSMAQLRKEQQKAPGLSNVVSFLQDFVN
ncbi:MAG: sensor domain-containing diguanylate cyclase [Pyrinomonadaceae bacterium]